MFSLFIIPINLFRVYQQCSLNYNAILYIYALWIWKHSLSTPIILHTNYLRKRILFLFSPSAWGETSTSLPVSGRNKSCSPNLGGGNCYLVLGKPRNENTKLKPRNLIQRENNLLATSDVLLNVQLEEMWNMLNILSNFRRHKTWIRFFHTPDSYCFIRAKYKELNIEQIFRITAVTVCEGNKFPGVANLYIILVLFCWMYYLLFM